MPKIKIKAPKRVKEAIKKRRKVIAKPKKVTKHKMTKGQLLTRK